MEIKVGEFYKTRGGEVRKIVYESKKDDVYKFLSVNPIDDDESWYTKDGLYWDDGSHSPYDIIEPAPKKVKVQGWLNVYGDGFHNFHSKKEDADHEADEHRIACVKIEIEVEEGEGL